jgi:hypothetical protein
MAAIEPLSEGAMKSLEAATEIRLGCLNHKMIVFPIRQ